ncbi:unnamed protein product [Alopecurus aequalis]
MCTVLAPYTVGLLQAGPFHDQTFVLWGTFLLLIQVNPESLSVYSIRDTEQRKRLLVQQVLQIFLVLWLMINGSGGNKSYSATIWIFWINSLILTYRTFRTKGSNKGGLVSQPKVIADYMGIEHELDQDDYDPSTMKGYRYIFYGVTQLQASLLPAAPDYRAGLTEVASNDRVLTIDSVWRWIDSQSFYPTETAQDYKDTALSFTFFQLLKRRFCGYRLDEAGRDKTLHLVLHGLLSKDGNYVRAFQVIELELAFLYDFFYTRMTNSHGPAALPSHIHTILVWHIATTIISHDVSMFLDEKMSTEAAVCIDRLVAKSLSDYCTYLVAFVPDMLPGHAYDTQCIFDAVVMEARQHLAGCETVSSRCEKLTGLHGNNGTILGMGAKLGREIKEQLQTNSSIDMVTDRALLWKALADFWAEFILFLAPSYNADIHAEKLAAGGEFMTHLWALLTHAGILDRSSSSSGVDPLGGFNGTTAQDSAV